MFGVGQLKDAETIERYSVRPRLKVLENNQQKNKEHQKREKDLLVYWFLVQTLTLSN